MDSPEHVDLIWVLLCTFLVFLMQAGFLCLETGLVRAKNSINVALKNLADFCLSSLAFWAVGFALMFGASLYGLIGSGGFLFDGRFDAAAPSAMLLAFFFFQLAFCGTSVTIVSGAVAERMTFRGYVLGAVLMAALIYPLFGHWAWGSFAGAGGAGWLEQLGFIDFAGSTVVHSVGGWVALAAVLVIGPRLGRYGADGRPIGGNNLSLSALGVLLLWLGWFGFNGGSTLALNEDVPGILVNTLLASAGGCLIGFLLTWRVEGRPSALDGMNGTLAGLVAVTANCHIVSAPEAVVIGGIGSAIAYGGRHVMDRYRIDDAVNAVPVHLFAGIWGTLAVALFGDPAAFATGGVLAQLGVQALGIAAAGAAAFGIAFAVFSVAKHCLALRVSEADERRGLNVTEHGASSALHDLLLAMEDQRQTGDFSNDVPVEPHTEAGIIAVQYNRVVERFNAEVCVREAIATALRAEKERAEVAAHAKSQFIANVSHELRTPLNAIIGFSEIINEEMFGPIGNEQYRDYILDINKSGRHLLSIINDILDLSKIEADKMKLTESDVDFADVAEETVRMVRARAEEAGINLAMDLHGALAPLRADARALRQIVLNLLSNAIKYTDEGGTVRLTAQIECDGRFAFTVSDDGIGMAREDIPRALEPFGQVTENAADFSPEGTGLGLPLTHAFVRLHGGTMVIRSAPGEGTEVTVRLPQSRVLMAPALALELAAEPARSA